MTELTANTFWEHYKNRMLQRFEKEELLDAFLAEIKMSFHWMQEQAEAIYLQSGQALCTLMVKAHSPQATFGFCCLSEDEKENQALWDDVTDIAQKRGIKKLTGPIQANTYFPYRFVTESDGSPFFKGEYFSSPSDHAFMMKQSPNQVHYYRSGYRNRFDGIMKVSEQYYNQAIEQGLKITKHRSVNEKLFGEISMLIPKIFGRNWSFESLGKNALKAIYRHEFGVEQKLLLHTYHYEGELIGFCRYLENEPETLICKTLGLLPEYQKKGFGNAGVYQMHVDAKDAGYERMIYALIYDGNRVQQNMPKDDSIIFRNYASYEFEVK